MASKHRCKVPVPLLGSNIHLDAGKYSRREATNDDRHVLPGGYAFLPTNSSFQPSTIQSSKLIAFPFSAIMTTPNAHLSIIVYKGYPDWQQFRHTSLWIRFSDESPATMFHIIGASGFFRFEAYENPNPTESKKFAEMVEVGYLTSPASFTQVRQALQRILIDNQDREFNCQTWVENALKRLVEDGQLSTADYDRALNGMVDAIAAAEDEPGW